VARAHRSVDDVPTVRTRRSADCLERASACDASEERYGRLSDVLLAAQPTSMYAPVWNCRRRELHCARHSKPEPTRDTDRLFSQYVVTGAFPRTATFPSTAAPHLVADWTAAQDSRDCTSGRRHDGVVVREVCGRHQRPVCG